MSTNGNGIGNGEMTAEEEARLNASERETLFESAQQIIECGDVLNWFAGAWRKVIAGEEKNAKLLYLIATSRLFTTCMNVAVKGPSAAGKSNIRKTVLEFFPPEDVISFTTLSREGAALLRGRLPAQNPVDGRGRRHRGKGHAGLPAARADQRRRARYPVVMKIADGESMTTVTS